MIFRVIVSLLCVAFCIGGCSSLTSQFFGTHKLRYFSIDQLVSSGLGDSDYVEISDVILQEDLVSVAASREWGREMIMFVGLSAADPSTSETTLVFWTERHDPNCIAQNSCFTPGKQSVRGLVARPSRLKNRVGELRERGYNIPEEPIYIEINRAPRAWYWNLLMMVGGFVVVFFLEQRYSQRRNKNA